MLGLLAGAAILATKLAPLAIALILALCVPLAAMVMLARHRRLLVLTIAMILMAGVGLIIHRDSFGLTWMMWLVLVVVVTDILGYFAGRLIAGPSSGQRSAPRKHGRAPSPVGLGRPLSAGFSWW